MTKSPSRPSQRQSVSIDFDGQEHHGEYLTADGLIEVLYKGRQKCTQLGGHEHYPESLAKLLLREMVSGMPDWGSSTDLAHHALRLVSRC